MKLQNFIRAVYGWLVALIGLLVVGFLATINVVLAIVVGILLILIVADIIMTY